MGREERREAVRRLERERDGRGRPSNARPRDRLGRPLPRGSRDKTIEYEPESVEEALAIGRRLWDEERFFEAHEVLEDVWHEAPAEDREFWQGVIQVAVACCHHQRENAAGSAALFARAADKLAGYDAQHHGIDVAWLRSFAVETSEAMASHGLRALTRYPRFPAADAGASTRGERP